MKLTLENTDLLVDVVTPDGTVPARLWTGQTESGIQVQVLVTRIAVLESDDQTAFLKELEETPYPRSAELSLAFPLRMVL
jgi:hypothetical protein